ncbi:hypothetical protein [Priestia megaterium]|uniref:hypothetical protein n=1 Tax=Priestia megaterium TaxID=1404 RepID=UPI001CDCBF70|nr:hypothetical protein [Priestia megaterium]MCA4157664.1 hypothetical protein [Priestia megaterium]
MRYYFVNFSFIGGTSKQYLIKTEDVDYDIVEFRVFRSNVKAGWFGVDNDYISLSNVTRVNWEQININDYDYEEADFHYLG